LDRSLDVIAEDSAEKTDSGTFAICANANNCRYWCENIKSQHFKSVEIRHVQYFLQ